MEMTSHTGYVKERTDRDPVFAAALTEVSVAVDLGREIALQRGYQGMTQRDLAERSGIKQPTIARIERGHQAVRVTTIMRLLAALEASLVLRQGHVAIRSLMDPSNESGLIAYEPGWYGLPWPPRKREEEDER